MKICKKCNVPMTVRKLQNDRRGHKQKNMLTKYYCPKCDHSKYGDTK